MPPLAPPSLALQCRPPCLPGAAAACELTAAGCCAVRDADELPSCLLQCSEGRDWLTAGSGSGSGGGSKDWAAGTGAWCLDVVLLQRHPSTCLQALSAAVSDAECVRELPVRLYAWGLNIETVRGRACMG